MRTTRPAGCCATWRAGFLVAALLAAAGTISGCHDDVTEVVLVLKSDIQILPGQDQISILAASGPLMPQRFSPQISDVLTRFPLSMGFVSSSGGDGIFSVTVQINRTAPPNFNTNLLISRSLIGIRFVPEQTRMLTVSLLSACACQGTSCPNPGTNPDCDDLTSPPTVPFDPTMAPPSSPFTWSPPFVSNSPETSPDRSKLPPS